MSFLEWALTITLVVVYFWLLFTVAIVTFRKGHIFLGIIGIFMPLLWLIGALLPARAGSSYDLEQRSMYG